MLRRAVLCLGLALAGPAAAEPGLAEALAANESAALLTQEIDSALGDLDLAADWVSTEAGNGVQLDAALMNARRVRARIGRLLPDLGRRSREVPADLPDLPPFFHWTGMERRSILAYADETRLVAANLGVLMEAAKAGDWQAIREIGQRQTEERTAFAGVWRAALEREIAEVPASHPGHHLARARLAFVATSDDFAAREAAGEPEEYRALTIGYAEAALAAAAEMQAAVAAARATVEAMRPALTERSLTLTGAGQLAEDISAGWLREIDIEERLADWLAGQARLEFEYYRDDWSEDLGDRFARSGVEMDAIFRARMAEAVARARLLMTALGQP